MGNRVWELATGNRDRAQGTGTGHLALDSGYRHRAPAAELSLAWHRPPALGSGTDIATGHRLGHWYWALGTGTEPDPGGKKGTTNK